MSLHNSDVPVVPALSSEDRHEPPGMKMPETMTDAHVGEAFGDTIRGRYVYCAALGGWLRNDGRRWKRDTTERIFEEARRFVITLGVEVLESDADTKTVAAAAGYRQRNKIDAVVTIARRLPGIVAEETEFDRHPHLLVARNGVVDLRTGELGPHDPTLRITQCTMTDYRPDARHPDVDSVLEVFTPGVAGWMQRLFGYAATGEVSEDVMPVGDGTGSNGKTTVLAAARSALGDYAHPVPPRLLMKSAHDEHPALFADLRGKRLAIIEETAEGGALRVETMKALTGGSSIKARFMRQDWFEFTPTHTLFIATNHRPAVNSTEHATWRRLRLIPFPYRYEHPDRARPGDRLVDLGLRARLQRGEAQREAMLAWIVAGAVEWYRDGLGECDDVRMATDAWRRSEDVILRYCHDRIVFGPAEKIGVQSVYEDFKAWCDGEGRPVSSLKEFRKKLEEHDIYAEHGCRWQKTMTGATWFGMITRSGL